MLPANKHDMTTPPPQAHLYARIPASSLLSPPETKLNDSFGSPLAPQLSSTSLTSGQAHSAMTSEPKKQGESHIYPWSPISPKVALDQKDDSGIQDVTAAAADPVLFAPGDNTSSVAFDRPLFPQDSELDADSENAITQHMANNDAVFKTARSKIQKPTRQEYRHVIFRSCWYESFKRNPQAYLAREIGYLKTYKYGTGWTRHRNWTPPKLAPKPGNGATTTTSNPGRAAGPSRGDRVSRPSRRSPKERSLDTIDPGSYKVSAKPARTIQKVEDKDFESVPDYSPSVDTLPTINNAKCLKVEWKGMALDLSSDPHRHLLHEAELNVASTLRLSCATYLSSKRRIFESYLNKLRKNDTFRKTDAQQACSIDVNKASKLWVAYDKVGWFKPEHFQEYL